MIFKRNTILVDSKDNSKIASEILPSGQEYVPLMSIIDLVDKHKLDEILLNYQNDSWNKRTRFCGVCGSKNNYDKSDNCKVCPSCGERFYPAQFPAVIVAITRGDEILLAHNKNFPRDLHSVIAGFVDLGETLEETVKREVMEEVGLKVKNIKYFDSQNWGFTSSLMAGFTCEYESGEIKIDNDEIVKAGWYKATDELPELPETISIARRLIDSFLKK